MFKKDQFIEDSINTAGKGKESIRLIMAKAVSDTVGIISVLGEPKYSGLQTIYRFPNLNFSLLILMVIYIISPINRGVYK